MRQCNADRFEIRHPESDLNGRSCMGDVYRAIDTKTGETVAVKAIEPTVDTRDPGILERFAGEGRALRQLNHPNIVCMVDAVEEKGQHHPVMEYVPVLVGSWWNICLRPTVPL